MKVLALALISWSVFHVSIYAQQPAYPLARPTDIVDDYHGTKVADPYRWLEDLDSGETASFVAEQNTFTSEYLGRLGPSDRIRTRILQLSTSSQTGQTWREAGRLFYTKRVEGKPQPVLYSLASAGAVPEVVLDPNEMSPGGSVFIFNYAVSPDGRFLKYTQSRSGSDQSMETHVRELATGRLLPDIVPGRITEWSGDSRGIFYQRTRTVAADTGQGVRRGTGLYYHRFGTSSAEDRLINEWYDSAVPWLFFRPSRDGRFLFVMLNRGGGANELYYLDLRDGLNPNFDAAVFGRLDNGGARSDILGGSGTSVYVLTDLEAPNRRVVRIDLEAGGRSEWHTVIPETVQPIEEAIFVADRIVLRYLRDVRSELRQFGLDGKLLGEIPLPGFGSAAMLAWGGQNATPELFYSFASYLRPTGVFRYDFLTGRTDPIHPASIPFEPDSFETKQIFYRSKDGTRVPMFVTARKGLRLDGSNPTILHAYGGYGSVTMPHYRPEWLLWLEMGGVLAVANIRGGGEYGKTWHHAGILEKKQNSFDDFISGAEYLIQERYTSSERLGVQGYSNGGLLVGAVLVQRPDLFSVALPEAGHHDMLRYHRFTNARLWVGEYGSPDDPSAFQYLYAYSPLHNVKSGTCYPATMVTASANDDRVVPSHSYKFTAALQAAQACNRPILLRVGQSGSHTFSPQEERIRGLTDVWTFVAARLRAKLPANAPAREE